jgi:DNA modification methylase
MAYQIITGDNRHTLKNLPDNSIDSIVTDPPYGIDFLGKAWDANTGALETYQECLRVLKPGGHILAFSAARTYHHLAVTLEQAGFEIRDQIMWIYSSGFPKSQDIGRSIQRSLGVKEYDGFVDTTKNSGFGQMDVARQKVGQEWSTKETQVGKAKVTDPEAKQWEGWGTALKPAHEPIALARKPIKLSIARNCQTHGVGALHIDACRVPYDSDADQPSGGDNGWSRVGFSETPVEKYADQKKSTKPKIGTMGKAPPNLNAIGTPSTIETSDQPWVPSDAGRFPSNVLGEIPNYQKYFYCPKVSRKERHIGMKDPGPLFSGTSRIDVYMSGAEGSTKPDQKRDGIAEVSGPGTNNHPTVKPIELMKYLIKLITPPGGTVLDPFTGSGSTGCAAVELDHPFIGCELDPAYVEIANRRIAAWHEHTQDPTTFNNLFSIEDSNGTNSQT